MTLGPLALQEHFPQTSGSEREDLLVWRTLEGFDAKPSYRREDAPRVAAPTVPEGKPYLRENIPVDDLASSNSAARAALARGATALGFVSRKEGDVRSERDMLRLLRGIPLASTPIHWEGAFVGPDLQARYFAAARKSGVPIEALRGSCAADPIATLVRQDSRRLEQAYDALEALVRLAADSRLRTVRVDIQPYHMAGATLVQELACALGVASEALAQLAKRGLRAADVVRRLVFSLSVGTSYLLEIAKLRAMRHLAVLLFTAYEVDASETTVDAVTSTWSHSRLDPHTNLIRVTTQAMAAVIGGCDTLTVQPLDPDEESKRLARNAHLILREESHLDAVKDPAAGSYYVETLTQKLGRHAWALFKEIEARGGMIQALERGFLQRALRRIREQKDTEIATGARVLVGVNAFPLAEAPPVSSAAARPPPENLDARTVDPLAHSRGAEVFESLRHQTLELGSVLGRRPEVYVVRCGELAALKDSVRWARRCFSCAGFALTYGPVVKNPVAAARAAAACDAHVIALCAPGRALSAVASEITRLGARQLLVTIEGEVSVREGFTLYPGMDMAAALMRIQAMIRPSGAAEAG